MLSFKFLINASPTHELQSPQKIIYSNINTQTNNTHKEVITTPCIPVLPIFSFLFFPFIITSPTSPPFLHFHMSPFTSIPVSLESKGKIKILNRRKRGLSLHDCFLRLFQSFTFKTPTEKKTGSHITKEKKKKNFN